MDVFQSHLVRQDGESVVMSSDPRLQPTPDYGTLGPGLDPPPTQISGCSDSDPRPSSGFRLLHFVVVMAGIGLAVAVSSAGGMATVWGKLTPQSSFNKDFEAASALSLDRDLDRQKPQKQAELLLERAMTRSDGGSDRVEAQIESRVDAWRGKLEWDSQLGQLTTAALNSNDRRVRDSAVEVQLAAYGLPKNESTVDALVRQAGSSDHRQKIWAFWSLGLLGNRGIETDRIVEVLGEHLKNFDGVAGKAVPKKQEKEQEEDARRWAVEGLALVGTTPTITPLLAAMHDDPSPLVRERAACSLAESGMLSHDQRLIAVPQLINYSDDPALDPQTHAWAFQALSDITHQRLPNDSAAWRNWYQNNTANN
ncbi:MAG: hypothetical protein WB919_19510 [Candidatus Sulfotelmatobacter sp.]